MDMARVLGRCLSTNCPGGAEDERHGVGVQLKLDTFCSSFPLLVSEGHGLAFEAVDLVIMTNSFRAMRSLLFSLSNSAVVIGDAGCTKRT